MYNKRLAEQIADRCEQAGCKEKIAKIHFDQALRGWDAHPPQDFCAWWSNHLHYREGIDVKRAWNCDCYRQEYLEAKQHGIIEAEVIVPLLEDVT